MWHLPLGLKEKLELATARRIGESPGKEPTFAPLQQTFLRRLMRFTLFL